MKQLENSDLQAFVEGRSSGFKAVFDVYYQGLLYFTDRLTGSTADAEEITADTFAKLFKKHEGFHSSENIKAFLYITARNNCLNFLKMMQRKKKRLKSVPFTPVADLPAVLDHELQCEITRAAAINAIHIEIEKLPPQCRRIFKMIYFDGKKTADIARELSLEPETIRNQKKRATDLLRMRLANNSMAFALLFLLTLHQGDLTLHSSTWPA